MVVDTLENLEKYASLNPLFAQAIEFLKSHDLQAMEIGKTELKGKDLLANISIRLLLSARFRHSSIMLSYFMALSPLQRFWL